MPFPAQFCGAGESLPTPARSEGNEKGKNVGNANNEVTPLHLKRAALYTKREKVSSHSRHCIPLRIRSRVPPRLACTRESVTIVWGDYLFSSLYKNLFLPFCLRGRAYVFCDVCTCCSCLLSTFSCSTLRSCVHFCVSVCACVCAFLSRLQTGCFDLLRFDSVRF